MSASTEYGVEHVSRRAGKKVSSKQPVVLHMADLRLDCRAAFFASAQRVTNAFLDAPDDMHGRAAFVVVSPVSFINEYVTGDFAVDRSSGSW